MHRRKTFQERNTATAVTQRYHSSRPRSRVAPSCGEPDLKGASTRSMTIMPETTFEAPQGPTITLTRFFAEVFVQCEEM